MDESLRAQVAVYLPHLDVLIRRGGELRDALAADPGNEAALVAHRAWMQDCGIAVNELSGGSKAHWLARAFSEAFLLRATDGRAVESVAPDQIVARMVDVLKKASASLAGMGDEQVSDSSATAPMPRRFEFVHNPGLRTILEQAYFESRLEFEQGRHDLALFATCGILEALVTDALEHKGIGALAAFDPPEGKIADWSFQSRLAIAERAGLIRGGCARLPLAARRYRETADTGRELGAQAVSERDARLAGQVLNVVMRDLDPGR